jgi:hypothetical protein
VTLAPERLVLRPGSSAALTVRADPGQRAGPGDHHVVILFTARPEVTTRVAVRVRLGIVLRIRVSGRIVRGVAVRGLRVVRRGSVRVLLGSLSNRGNVSEDLRGRVTIALARSGRVLARLRADAPRELRPGAQAVFRARYAGGARGFVRAVVTARLAGAARTFRREYSLRL